MTRWYRMKARSKVTSILSSHAKMHFQAILSEYQSGHLLSSWFCPIPFGGLTTREQTIEKTAHPNTRMLIKLLQGFPGRNLGLRVGNCPAHDREFH